MSEATTGAGAADLVVDLRGMPYDLDGGLGERARIGLVVLSSDRTIEHEFRSMLDLPGVAFYESRIPNDNEITPETLAAMERRIAASVELIMPGDPLDVVAYGCTSASMVIGPERVHARIREARPGVACTTPMEAVVAGLHALDARRIAFLPPYLDEINRPMRDYVRAQGVEVPVMGSWNISDDSAVARLSPRTVREAVLELGAHDCVDAVFVSCTSVRLAEQIEDIEQSLGKPVTSSNHATAWHCLRLAGVEDRVAGFGELFRRPLV